jgi:hypothetical protein
MVKKASEHNRLKALEQFEIVNTPPESAYDAIAKIASEISQAPIAQINFIDTINQYSKSSIGIPLGLVPRDFAFCNHTIQHPFEPTIVPDMRLDARFQHHPAVTGEPFIQSYTGIPLTTSEGNAIGSLCVMDFHPMQLSNSQLETLKALAEQVIVNLELRKNNNLLLVKQQELKNKYAELEQFAYVVSHDLKSPLNNIIALVQLLQSDYKKQLDDSGILVMNYLEASSERLKKFIDGILEFYRGDYILENKKEEIELVEFLTGLASLNNALKEVDFKFPTDPVHLVANRVALEQIFLNLFVNAIKYNDKKTPTVAVSFSSDDQFYYFEVKDNGVGIEKSKLQEIFDLFSNLNVRDRLGNLGTGIGLSTVKKLVEKSGGSIRVTSEPHVGTTFSFSLKQ